MTKQNQEYLVCDQGFGAVLYHPVVYPETKVVRNGEPSQIYQYIKNKSDEGVERFQILYAICLLRGLLVDQDIRKAKDLIQAVQDTCEPDALAILGELYQYSYIKDEGGRAKAIFQKLAELCPFKGYYMLARFHHSESLRDGSNTTRQEVLRFYEKASSSGHLISAFLLSSLCHESDAARRIRFVRLRLSEIIFGPKLCRQERLWRYRDLRLLSPRLYSKYDLMCKSVGGR